MRHRSPARAAALLAALFALALPLAGAAPPPVEGLVFEDELTLAWAPAPGATDYSVYRGLVRELSRGGAPRCHANELPSPSFSTPALPEPGAAFAYLVTAEDAAGEEGSAGASSGGAPRALAGLCDPLERHHVLTRAGFGDDEWTRARIVELGIDAYLDEQLSPATIPESQEFFERMAPLDPPIEFIRLVAQSTVRGVYSRRQLEQSLTLFWNNHFNTNYQEIVPFFIGFGRPPELVEEIAVTLLYEEMMSFRELALGGSFREIVEASTIGPPMILYLDTNENVVGAPNENMARELLELYTMGVDGGYTQKDVEELARVLTGWTVCKKAPPNVDDPLAACIPRILEDAQPGEHVAHFRVDRHDPGEKVLFEGTAYETIIPDTSATPAAGVDDIEIALDAIVAHPATPRFISRKLAQWFVDDAPPEALVDELVSVWEASGGDLFELTRAIVTSEEFREPDLFRAKVRTPLEHVIAAFRATRGKTYGVGPLRQYLPRMQHVPHNNPVPTGYPEVGDAWIDTNNILERQNFGMDLAESTENGFGTDLIGLMADEGLSAASDAGEIVDFWAARLFGGALTPDERAEAIDYLSTDDEGNPAPADDERVRETVGFMLGFPHFMEQ